MVQAKIPLTWIKAPKLWPKCLLSNTEYDLGNTKFCTAKILYKVYRYFLSNSSGRYWFPTLGFQQHNTAIISSRDTTKFHLKHTYGTYTQKNNHAPKANLLSILFIKLKTYRSVTYRV